jgi:hypothetical protein
MSNVTQRRHDQPKGGAAMAWTSDQLARIGEAEELQVSSYRRDGTLRRWTPIWVVRLGDVLYVRSAYGRDSDWYRHATQNTARIRAGGVEADVTLLPVDDATINAQVGTAYESKYGNQPGALRPMLVPPASDTTVRLDR